jgi:hypothetical protein
VVLGFRLRITNPPKNFSSNSSRHMFLNTHFTFLDGSRNSQHIFFILCGFSFFMIPSWYQEQVTDDVPIYPNLSTLSGWIAYLHGTMLDTTLMYIGAE